MHCLSVILFSVSANLDSLAIGMLYGIRGRRIPLRSNLIVGLVVLAGTALSMTLGSVAGVGLGRPIQALAGALVIILGVAGLFQALCATRKSKGNQPDAPGNGERGAVTAAQALPLGVALSANNAGIGIGAGALGVGVIQSAVCSLAASFIFLFAANRAGMIFRRKSGAECAGDAAARKNPELYISVAASLLLVVLGVYELIV